LNRALLQDLAKTRFDDAKVLLDNQRFAGAYYLAGYAIECALKACIARQTREGDFPPDRKTVEKYYNHNLRGLCKEAGVPLEEKSRSDEAFERYWNVVADWSEQSRYDPAPRRSERFLKDFVRAVGEVVQWLQEHW
jgi:AbiV family abortive infection protein